MYIYVYTTLRNVILSFKTISTGAPEPISTELHHSSKKNFIQIFFNGQGRALQLVFYKLLCQSKKMKI